MDLTRRNLVLLAPSGMQASKYFGSVRTDSTAHSAHLRGLKALRDEVYGREFAGAAPDEGADRGYSGVDAVCWHIAAKDDADGSLVGCIRLRFLDLREDDVSAEQFMGLGGIEFEDSIEAAIHLHLIQRYLARIRLESHELVYVGGLAVRHPKHGLGHGTVLGLAGHALSRILGVREGVTFASSANGAADLLQRIGGYRLAPDRGPFRCRRHGSTGELLGLKTSGLGPAVERVARDLVLNFRHQSVLAPN